MKTLTKSTAAILMVLFLSTNMFADGIEMERESYIDDIPFNTYEIASNKLYELAMEKDFDMEDEVYVEDIPFNTQQIVSQSADSTFFIASK